MQSRVPRPSPRPDDTKAMLLASEPQETEAYLLSRGVNTPRNDPEELLDTAA